jgi:hypothetical protein
MTFPAMIFMLLLLGFVIGGKDFLTAIGCISILAGTPYAVYAAMYEKEVCQKFLAIESFVSQPTISIGFIVCAALLIACVCVVSLKLVLAN